MELSNGRFVEAHFDEGAGGLIQNKALAISIVIRCAIAPQQSPHGAASAGYRLAAMPTDPANLPEPQSTNASDVGILGVVITYAAFATVWILLSDKALEWLFATPEQIILASTFKGAFFVIVTSGLLFWLLRRIAKPTPDRRIPVAPSDTVSPQNTPTVVLVATIVTLTIAAINHNAIKQRDLEVSRLQAIADLRTRQIADWLNERRADAGFLQSSPFLAASYLHWRNDGDVAKLDTLEARLDQMSQSRGYAGALLLDCRGERLWGSARAPMEIASPLQESIRQSVLDHQVHWVGPYLDPAGTPSLDIVVPLKAAGANPPLIVLHMELTDWLYPTLQSWPVPSASGETLLFRRDGDQVQYLNDLRHQSGAAAALRVPVSATRVLAAQVLRGNDRSGGTLEGEDYRGVTALGVVHAVPGTDWFLIAKMDRDEVYAETLQDSVWITLSGLLAIAATFGAAHLLRQRHALAIAASVQSSQAERLKALGLLAAIADSSNDAIFAKDLNGRYTLINPAACDFVGKTANEVLGRDDRELFPLKQAEMLMATGCLVIAENRLHTQEVHLATPHGDRWFQDTQGPLHDAEGKVTGIFGIARDITAGKAAQDELRQSEMRWQFAVESHGDAMWDWDSEDDELFLTVAAKDLFNLADKASPRPIFDLLEQVFPEDRTLLQSQLGDILLGKTSDWAGEWRFTQPDGPLRWISVRGRVMTWSADGQPKRVVSISRDVTQQKFKAAEAKQHGELLAHRARLVLLGELSSALIHEINQPLTAISGLAAACARETAENPEALQLARAIEAQAMRAGAISWRLRGFSRRQSIGRSAQSLTELVARVVNWIRLDSTYRNVIIDTVNLSNLPRVDADQVELEQVLVNLVRNAIEASPPNEERLRIAIAGCLGKLPDEIEVSITDWGSGLSPDIEVDNLQPFTSTKEHGLGLGLTICRSILEGHGGRLWATSNPEGGTVFHFTLPIANGEPSDRSKPSALTKNGLQR